MQPTIRVFIVKGAEAGSPTSFQFSQGFSLGRESTNAIPLASPLVSRAHAEVVYQAGQWILVDRKSTNGLWVQGKRVSEVPLVEEIEVEFGRNGPLVRFSPEPPTTEIPPAAPDWQATAGWQALGQLSNVAPAAAEPAGLASGFFKALTEDSPPASPSPERPVAPSPSTDLPNPALGTPAFDTDLFKDAAEVSPFNDLASLPQWDALEVKPEPSSFGLDSGIFKAISDLTPPSSPPSIETDSAPSSGLDSGIFKAISDLTPPPLPSIETDSAPSSGLDSGIFKAISDLTPPSSPPSIETDSAPSSGLDSGIFKAISDLMPPSSTLAEAANPEAKPSSSSFFQSLDHLGKTSGAATIPPPADPFADPPIEAKPPAKGPEASPSVADFSGLGTGFFAALTDETTGAGPEPPTQDPQLGLNTGLFSALSELKSSLGDAEPPTVFPPASEELAKPELPSDLPQAKVDAGMNTAFFAALKSSLSDEKPKTDAGISTGFLKSLDELAAQAPEAAPETPFLADAYQAPKPNEPAPDWGIQGGWSSIQPASPTAPKDDAKPKSDWDTSKQDWGAPSAGWGGEPAKPATPFDWSSPATPAFPATESTPSTPSTPRPSFDWNAPSTPSTPSPSFDWNAPSTPSTPSPSFDWNAPSTPSNPTPSTPTWNAPAKPPASSDWSAPNTPIAPQGAWDKPTTPATPAPPSAAGEGWGGGSKWEPSAMSPAYQPPTSTPPPPAGSVSGYVKKFEDGSTEGMGSRTAMMMQAFKSMSKREKKRYYIIIGIVAFGLIVAAVWAWIKHSESDSLSIALVSSKKSLSTQDSLNTVLFYQIKELQLKFANDSTLQKNKNLRDETARKIMEMQQAYLSKMRARQEYRALNTTTTGAPVGCNVDRMIYDITRLFGENEMAMPPEYVEKVKQYIRYWQSSPRYRNALQTAINNNYVDFIVGNFMKMGVPPQFFYLGMQESNFNTQIVGPPTRYGHAKGMWQFIPATGERYGLRSGPLKDSGVYDPQDERHIPDRAANAAARYLADIYKTDAQASGLLVMASYNWGEGNVIKKIRALPLNPRDRNFWALYTQAWMPEETKNYVFYIVSAAVIGENPRCFNQPFDNPLQAAIQRVGSGQWVPPSSGGLPADLPPLTMTVSGEQEELFKHRTFW